MKLTCWYHAWTAGAWREPLGEHLRTLEGSGFRGTLRWGAVGPETGTAEAQALLGSEPAVVARKGYEQVTLHALWEWAQESEGAVLYAHTKGASGSQDAELWRRCMALRVVDNWRANLKALEDYQALGCMWITADAFPRITVRSPFFAGNYWMARCDYLRTLPAPDPQSDDRMRGEDWIGEGRPKVLDLLPGWPNEATFRRGVGCS